MKCAMCGYRFEPQKTHAVCKGATACSGCKLIKCPNCGYKTPPTPEWLKKIFDKEE